MKKIKITQVVSKQEADFQDLQKLSEKVINIAAKYNYNNIKLVDALNDFMEHIKCNEQHN